MLDPESILRLFANVLHNDIVVNSVPTQEIRKSVQSMAHVYAAENTTFESSVLKFLNFNDTACRCAYLHKYAPLHTYIVFDAMLKMFQKELPLFRNLVTDNEVLKLCSLGGGPGSDVIGVLSALKVVFGTVKASVSIVDCMEKWESTFQAVLKELKFGGYGPDWYYFANDMEWNYIGANLLCTMSNEVNTAIGSASLITMMKFISASVCTNTEEMVDKIFRVMKVGALVLYIDNAAGGFTQLIERSSRKNGLVPVVGPLRHVQYDAEALKVHRFGYSSCFQTKVTIILLRKVQKPNLNREVLADPNRLLLQGGPKPRQKLDFVVFDSCRNDDSSNQAPLDVNVFSPELNNACGADSKCVEKYPGKLVNNLGAFPAKSSNVARTSQDFIGTTMGIPPPNSSSVAPRKSNPTSSQTPNRVVPRKSNPTSSQTPNRVAPRNSNPMFSQTPNRVATRSYPVSRTPAAAQRYQPVSSVENNAPPQELVDESDDAGCSCCVIS